MINPKDELRAYLDQLIHRFLNIRGLFNELNRVYTWYDSADRIKTINLSNYFFRLSTYSMSRIYLVELAIMLSKKEERSLFDWLKKAQEHAKAIEPNRFNLNIFPERREPIEPKEYKAIIEKHREQLLSQDNLIKNIKALRDKTIAHLDKTYFNEPSAIYKDYPIEKDNIDQLIEMIGEILHEHYSYLFEADLRMEIMSESHVDVVLKYARSFQRVRVNRAFIEKGFKPVDYMNDEYYV